VLLFARSDASLLANIGNILRGKSTVLTRSAIGLTTPKVNRFGWNLEQCEPNVCGCPWQILGAIRAVVTVWEGAEIFFVTRITHDFTDFPWDKYYDIWTQQRRSVSPCKLSEQNFENFTIRGGFSQKTQKLLTKFPGLATSGRHNVAMVTDLPEIHFQMVPLLDKLVSTFTIKINSKSFL